MSNIRLDEPRFEEMQKFLNRLYYIGRNYSDISIDHGLVYKELCNYTLGDDEKTLDGKGLNYYKLFNDWQERNKHAGSEEKGLVVEHDANWDYFLQFYSKGDHETLVSDHDFIKLYIPLKFHNLFDNVNKLFDFIRDFKIKHLSKISAEMRSDNVVIRLDKRDMASALKIIDFVKHDEVLSQSLNETNPFLPTINGVGIMYETGISYNGDLSELISKYIKECVLRKDPPVLSDFYKWFEARNYSTELDDIFSYAIGKKTSFDYEDKMSDQDKYHLLVDGLKETFLKYDFNQAAIALKTLIEKGTYQYFTNGSGEIKYRDELSRNVSKEDAKRYVRMLSKEDSRNNLFRENIFDENEIGVHDIILFCEEVFKEDLLDRFCNACLVTFLNYNQLQLECALRKMIENNDSSEFSRFSRYDASHSINHREVIEKHNSKGIINLIKLFLRVNKCDKPVDNNDELIELFSTELINWYYQNGDNKHRNR